MDDKRTIPTGQKIEAPTPERPVDRDHSEMGKIGTDIAQRNEPAKEPDKIPPMGSFPVAN